LGTQGERQANQQEGESQHEAAKEGAKAAEWGEG